MDRPLPAQKWSRKRIAVLAGASVGALMLVYVAVANFGRSRLSIESARLSVSPVTRGEFKEYVPINGTVQPNTTVYLDLEEGGIVEKIYIQGGNPVKKGDLILGFSNTGAQKENIETETRLLENLDQLRNSKFTLTTSNLVLKDQLLDVGQKIRDLERTFARYEKLMKQPNSLITADQYESTKDQVQYYKDKRDLLQERIRRETELEVQQSKQIDESIVRVNRNLNLLSRIVDSLEVRAPIDGHLSTLSAEIGQSFQRGQRIGQIDQLESLKVRGTIDQFYISKVTVGQRATFEFDGAPVELEVAKIYPEVTNDSFQVDMVFVSGSPQGLKRGQTLQIDLGLSAPKTTNVVAKGSFYRYTNGRWAYLLAADGRSARRVKLVLGRQNPQSVEVLEGLAAGDWIINSNYDSFHDVDELSFPEPIKH